MEKKTNTKKALSLSALATGTLMLGSMGAAQASNSLEFENLGDGNEIRSDIMSHDAVNFVANELKCGEDGKKEGKSGEHKCGEGKCGEGKCGEKTTEEGKSGEHKCGEGKCGEGKCGEKSDKKKAETKSEKKTDDN